MQKCLYKDEKEEYKNKQQDGVLNFFFLRPIIIINVIMNNARNYLGLLLHDNPHRRRSQSPDFSPFKLIIYFPELLLLNKKQLCYYAG